MKQVWKGLLMTFITSLASALAAGLPQDLPHWYILGLTILGTIIGYFAQSTIFPSTSKAGDINGLDFLKGFLVALSNMLSTIGADVIVGHTLNWSQIAGSVVTVFLAYFVKQFAIPPTKYTRNKKLKHEK